MSKTERKRMLAAAGTVSTATFLSRILGAFRDMIIAWSFPAGTTDAFFVAFRLPNLMRRLFGEGALTVSTLPIFTELLQRDTEEARRVFRAATALLTIVLTGIVILGVIFSKYIVWIFAPGFSDDPVKIALTIRLTQVMFPFLLLVSLVALAQGMLNALGHFWAPAIAPALLNIVMIGGIMWLSPFCREPIYGLAWGVVIGGAAEVILQIPYLVKRGYTPSMLFKFGHPSLKKMFILMGPAAFGMLVYQINMLVSTIFASLLPEGSISWLFYSQRFTELPLGLIAVAMGTAMLPTMSKHAASGDVDGFKSSYRFSLKTVLFLMTPSAIGLLVLSIPIFSTFYQRGHFTHHDAQMTAFSLLAYIPGLLAIAGTRVTSPAFYARQNTYVPVRIAALAFGVNLVAGVILMGPHYIIDPLWRSLTPEPLPVWYAARIGNFGLGCVGLAFATTISAWYNFLAHLFHLRKEMGKLGMREVTFSLLKTACSCIPMVIVAGLISWFGWANWKAGGMSLRNISTLLSAAVAGAICFFITAYLLKQEEVTIIFDAIRRRFRRAA